MRDSPLDEGRRWIEQAEEDLKWAVHLAREGGFHIACFLAQQIGEKALKGFLYAKGEEIVTGHSIERLCHRAVKWDPEFKSLVERWSILDQFYVPTRYPNGLPDGIPARVYTRDAASDAVRLAGEILSSVSSKLPL